MKKIKEKIIKDFILLLVFMLVVAPFLMALVMQAFLVAFVAPFPPFRETFLEAVYMVGGSVIVFLVVSFVGTFLATKGKLTPGKILRELWENGISVCGRESQSE